jgi:hypothetical protein
MMLETLEQTIASSLNTQVRVIQEGLTRYPIFTPFTLPDGDHFDVVLIAVESGSVWKLTDEGSTLMHLSYWTPYEALMRGSRKNVIDNVLSRHAVQNDNGVLYLEFPPHQLGNALMTYLQALTQVSDIEFLNKEQVRETFREDFNTFMREIVPPERLKLNYNHPTHDPNEIYTVDARINGLPEPFYIFAIGTNDRCRDVTITLHTMEKWPIKFQSVAIFRDQQSIARDVLARFSDVGGKQFASLTSSGVAIRSYFEKRILDPA